LRVQSATAEAKTSRTPAAAGVVRSAAAAAAVFLNKMKTDREAVILQMTARLRPEYGGGSLIGEDVILVLKKK